MREKKYDIYYPGFPPLTDFEKLPRLILSRRKLTELCTNTPVISSLGHRSQIFLSTLSKVCPPKNDLKCI